MAGTSTFRQKSYYASLMKKYKESAGNDYQPWNPNWDREKASAEIKRLIDGIQRATGLTPETDNVPTPEQLNYIKTLNEAAEKAGRPKIESAPKTKAEASKQINQLKGDRFEGQENLSYVHEEGEHIFITEARRVWKVATPKEKEILQSVVGYIKRGNDVSER